MGSATFPTVAIVSIATLVTNACGFCARPPVVSIHPHVDHKALFMSESTNERGTIDRRGWIPQAVGAAIVTGIVANKVAIEGPQPYQPPPKSLENKVVVVTGGNTGLGLESAKRLAKGGATVVLTSRSIEKGLKAVEQVKEACIEDDVANNNIYSAELDLCDLANVKTFPDRLVKILGGSKIDVLLNNAGVMAIPNMQTTKDGLERTFQTNHLGHFALTAVLMPLLNSQGCRVINVSSSAYQICSKGLDLENLNGEKGYQPWVAYGQSKLENILFTKELQRLANDSGRKLTAVSLHPGSVRTDLARYLIGEDKYVPMQDGANMNPQLSVDTIALLPMVYFTKPVDRGATSQVWLASGQGFAVEGKFFQNCKEQQLNGAATDMEMAKALWRKSETLAGVQFRV